MTAVPDAVSVRVSEPGIDAAKNPSTTGAVTVGSPGAVTSTVRPSRWT
jgi:hypothetical protein